MFAATGLITNSEMGPVEVWDYCKTDDTGQRLLQAAMKQMDHDIGHSPFSHTGEDKLFATGKRHEHYGEDILLSPELGIGDIVDGQAERWGVTKLESTEGGRRVSVLKRQEGAPVNLG